MVARPMSRRRSPGVGDQVGRGEVRLLGGDQLRDGAPGLGQAVAGAVQRVHQVVSARCSAAGASPVMRSAVPGHDSLAMTALGEQASRPEHQGDQEGRRLDEHDRGAARDVEPVGQVEADHGARDPDHARQQHQPREPHRQELGGGGGRDQHRDHQDDPDGLQADDDRQRHEGEEQVLEAVDLDARGGGAERVERRVQELLPQERHRDDHAAAEDHQRDQVLRCRWPARCRTGS